MPSKKTIPFLWMLAAFALTGLHMLACPLYIVPLVEDGYGSVDVTATNMAINLVHGLFLGIVGAGAVGCAAARVIDGAWPWALMESSDGE